VARGDGRDAEAALIVIDSNVFVIDLRYPRDPLAKTNRRFLDVVRERGDGATTPVNLLEVAGILSHNLNAQQLRDLVVHFDRHYGIRYLPDLPYTASLPSFPILELMGIIERRAAFGDALVLAMLDRYAPPDTIFVSWDAKHFTGKTRSEVMTPEQFLEPTPNLR
jgi:predicted nucleic acid-binding protein